MTYYNPVTGKQSNVAPSSTIYSRYKDIKVTSSSPIYSSIEEKQRSLLSGSSGSSSYGTDALGQGTSSQYAQLVDNPYSQETYDIIQGLLGQSKSLKSVGSGGVPVQTQSRNTWYTRLDTTVFKGFLPGGISRPDYVSQYSVPALDAKTDSERELREAKDRLESMRQMQKLKDKESDYAYKMAWEQAELDYKKELERVKQEQDATNQNWFEALTGKEKELEFARQNVAQEQEARYIESQINALKSQNSSSSLDKIESSFVQKETSNFAKSPLGQGLIYGGLALVAVFALKK